MSVAAAKASQTALIMAVALSDRKSPKISGVLACTRRLEPYIAREQKRGHLPTLEDCEEYLTHVSEGLIARRRNRRCRVTVTLYTAAAQRIRERDEHGRLFPYVVLCETHGTHVMAGAMVEAEANLRHPERFCEECRKRAL